MSEDSIQITCNRCEEPIRLMSHEEVGMPDYTLTCDCEMTEIDVSDCVNGNNLLEPLTGRWSTLNPR